MSESPQGRIVTQNAALLSMLHENTLEMDQQRQMSGQPINHPQWDDPDEGQDDAVKVYVDSPVFTHDDDKYHFVSTNVDDSLDTNRDNEGVHSQGAAAKPAAHGKPPLPKNSQTAKDNGEISYEATRLKNNQRQSHSSTSGQRNAQFLIRSGDERKLQQNQGQRSGAASGQGHVSGQGHSADLANKSRTNTIGSRMSQVRPIEPIHSPFRKTDPSIQKDDEDLRQESEYQIKLQERMEAQKTETENIEIPKLDLEDSGDEAVVGNSLELEQFTGSKPHKQTNAIMYDSLDVDQGAPQEHIDPRDSLEDEGDRHQEFMDHQQPDPRDPMPDPRDPYSTHVEPAVTKEQRLQQLFQQHQQTDQLPEQVNAQSVIKQRGPTQQILGSRSSLQSHPAPAQTGPADLAVRSGGQSGVAGINEGAQSLNVTNQQGLTQIPQSQPGVAQQQPTSIMPGNLHNAISNQPAPAQVKPVQGHVYQTNPGGFPGGLQQQHGQYGSNPALMQTSGVQYAMATQPQATANYNEIQHTHDGAQLTQYQFVRNVGYVPMEVAENQTSFQQYALAPQAYAEAQHQSVPQQPVYLNAAGQPIQVVPQFDGGNQSMQYGDLRGQPVYPYPVAAAQPMQQGFQEQPQQNMTHYYGLVERYPQGIPQGVHPSQGIPQRVSPSQGIPQRVSPQNHHDAQQQWYSSPRPRADNHYGPDVYYRAQENNMPPGGAHVHPDKGASENASKAPSKSPSVASKPSVNYVEENKRKLGKSEAQTYRKMYTKKKEVNSAPPALNTGGHQRQMNGHSSQQSGASISAEELWMKRSQSLSQQKMDKLSGKKARKLSKQSSDSRVAVPGNADPSRPHYVQPMAHRHVPQQAFADPGVTASSPRSPGQPVTHTVYTEDGQRVSVDINLKVLSPPPSTHDERVRVQGQYAKQGVPANFRPADYRPDQPLYHQPMRGYGPRYSEAGSEDIYQYKEEYENEGYSSPRDVWGEQRGYGDAGYDPHTPGSVGSPYKVLPPINTSNSEKDQYSYRSNHSNRPSKPRNKENRPPPPREESPPRGMLQGSYREEFQRNKTRKSPEYKVYTLDDYKQLRKEYKMGGLGPDLDNDMLKEKKEKINRQQDYAKRVSERNKQRQVAPHQPSQTSEDDEEEKDDILNRRKVALQYARNVPKPKVVPKNALRTKGTQVSVPAVRRYTPGEMGTNTNDDEENDVIDLEELKARHEREMAAVASIKQNLDGGAISQNA